MEKLLKKALIVVLILTGACTALAVLAAKYWVAGDYAGAAQYIGIIFMLFGLFVYAFRLAVFPDEGVDEHGQ